MAIANLRALGMIQAENKITPPDDDDDDDDDDVIKWSFICTTVALQYQLDIRWKFLL